MRTLIFILLSCIIIFSAREISPQNKNPDEILDGVKQAFKMIEDYEVDISVKIDVDFLKVPDSEARLYFKQPDKILVESEKFALLPKQGLNFSPLTLLGRKYTAFYEREDTIQNITTSVVKIIPLGNDSDIILSTFWVDQSRNLIIRVESTRKPTGTFIIDFIYKKYNDYYNLPYKMEFTFSVDKMMLPRGMDGQPDEEDDDKSKSTTGRVYITYTNYKVNQGLPDELFESKNSK